NTKVLMQRAPLVHYGAEYFDQWFKRLQHFVEQGQLPRGAEALLPRLQEHYGDMVRMLCKLPKSLLHGEFYASNVLVERKPTGWPTWPGDWEMAAVGPGLLDLAALTAGKWSEVHRKAIALAYWEELPGETRQDSAEFFRDLDLCRLFLGVQWLAWSPAWSPP